MSEILEAPGQQVGSASCAGDGRGSDEKSGSATSSEDGSGRSGGGLASPGRDCVVCLHAKPTMRFNKCGELVVELPPCEHKAQPMLQPKLIHRDLHVQGHLCTCKPCLSLYLESKNITLDGHTRKRFASVESASSGLSAVGLGERMDCMHNDDTYGE